MCGFAGFVGEVEDREQVLVNMMNTIIHRGPDSEGKYVDEEAALGFRRLSIIDLSSVGDQPLYNEDRTMVLVFNGEIYNYQELREELAAAGHIFVSNTDSETLIHGFEEWGESLVDRLRGMYAFAIWDTKKKKLFAARDIFGIKPLYYAQMNGTLMFASEIKAFMEHPKFDKIFNEDALGNYLSFQFVPTNETFFKGVFCLQPGHYFTYEDGKIKITRYFEPNFTGDSTKTFEEVVDEVEAVMKESVEKHKISDVEVASYLSSGVDSSYLTWLGQVDRTFTVGFDEGQYSEIRDAKEFAASINMKNDAKVITPDEYWDKLSDIQYYMDEPVADPAAIALYFLSEEAAKKVKVVLSGEGSDELFGGYNIYCEPLEHTAFNKIPFPVRRLLGRFAEYCLPRGMKGRGFLIRHGKTLEERYFANATNIFTEREANKILKKGCAPKIQEVTRPLYDRVRDKDAVNGACLICEMFSFYKTKGMSLLERLEELYQTYGYCLNTLHSYEFAGSAGFAQMQKIMSAFRAGVQEFGGKKVAAVQDYARGLDGLPASDVLKFQLEDHGSIVIRPSGTEPKLKIYVSVSAANQVEAQAIENRIVKGAEAIIEK